MQKMTNTYFIVPPIKEVISEAPGDHGTCFQDLGHVFSPDHHVSVVELDVHVRLLVNQVISSSSRGQPNQFPEVTAQLMAAGSLHFRKGGGEKGERRRQKTNIIGDFNLCQNC